VFTIEKGFIGEFNIYLLKNDKIPLVDPDPDNQSNFELFKKGTSQLTDDSVRRLRLVVLEENESLLPVQVEGTEDFYEGLYLKETKF
jgi:hypothetical protein